MSHRVVQWHTLACDGCGKRFGLESQYPSLVEARAAAYAEGWRFPPREKVDGNESTVVSDVCADCVPGWVRQPAPNNWGRRARRDGAR